MICSVCHQETNAVQVGTGQYCQHCTNRLGAPTPTSAGNRSLDIRASSSNATTATNLHARTRPSGRNVIDLRQARIDAATPPAPMKHTAMSGISAAPVASHQDRPKAPKTTAKRQHLAHFEDRFERAKQVERSQHVSKFGHAGLQPSAAVAAPAAPPPPPPPTPIRNHDAVNTPAHMPELPNHVVTQHQALARLAVTPQPLPPRPIARPTSRSAFAALRGPRTSQYATMAAAIAIMGGYIWLQNYPKLAVQNASQQAGINVSLPGYLPSSYKLAETKTQPGLVTFQFKSPSHPNPLTISQHRTTWDSSSLLDNFVSKRSAEYTAIENQGLTIYLFGQNQAAWVNHGVQYTIEGASRLSREQILKIAYSL